MGHHHHSCPPPPHCYPVLFVPVCWPQTVLREIDVDTTTSTAQGLVGGSVPARLTVEYLVESGGSSPSVTVKVTTDGQAATWSDTAIAAGYHVNDQLPPARPGSRVSLEASGALARVRWCECVCC